MKGDFCVSVESKLTVIKIRNFMSIEDATIEFDDSNIISLCGYNDSGKSAITRALECIFYNAYSNDHASFIKDGCDHWAIGLEFSDGVKINMFKHDNGKTVYEMWKDDTLVFSNKNEQGTIMAMADVPEQIQNYLGVIRVKDDSMNEQLNVRRNVDKLFLINTTGGENYKMLNTILRSDVLASASKKVTEDKNALNTNVQNLKTSCQTLKAEHLGIDVVDDDTLSALREDTKVFASKKERLASVEDVKAKLDKMSDLVVYDEVELIDASRMMDVMAILKLKEDCSVPVYDEVNKVDVTRYTEICDIMEKKKAISEALPPELSPISTERFEDLVKLCTYYNKFLEDNNALTAVSAEHKEIQAQLATLAEQYDFKICQNCGSVVQ